MKPKMTLGKAALLIAAFSILPLASSQAVGVWQNTDETWEPDHTTQNWNLASNWDGLPASGTIVYWGSGKGTSYIDTGFTIARLFLGSNTSASGTRGVWIGDGGSLTVTTANYFEVSNAGGSQLLTITSGGSLTAPSLLLGKTGGGTALMTSEGTISVAKLTTASGAEFQMKGGTFTSGTISLGTSSSINPNDGKLIQTGGAITGSMVQLNGGGTYQISGGSLAASSNLYVAYANATPISEGGSLGGTFHVVGSGASSINFAGGLRYYSVNERNKMRWAFTLDNGANHITTVNFAVDGAELGKLRGGTLDVKLDGGVMLSGTNALTLFEAPNIYTTSNFVNAADFEGGTAKLWTQSIVDGTRDSLKVTLNNASKKGILNAAGPHSLNFAASNYGYVTLANVSLDEPLTLLLDLEGGTLSNFTDSLTAAGVTWAPVASGGYDVSIILNPAVSGATQFAWDLSSIDSGMTLQSIATHSIPPPQPPGTWQNMDEAWEPDHTTQNWNLVYNWSSPPASDTMVFWGSDKGTSYIDTSFTIARLYLGNNTSASGTRGVWIGDGGSLAVTTSYFEVSNAGGSQLLTIASGGSLTAPSLRLGKTGGGTALMTNEGTISVTQLTTALGAEFQMKGGTFTSGTISLGTSSSLNPNDGKLIQTGGAITGGMVQLNGGGTYQIGGGSLAASNILYVAYANATAISEGGSLGGTFHVVGSGASSINFAGGLRYYSQADRDKMRWAFTVDNSASHITTVNFAANGNAAGKLRGGTLDVMLDGGVMLSGTNALTLFEAPDIYTTSNFVNAADFEGATAKLWTQSIVNDTRDSLKVTLNNASNKGTLDAAGAHSINFTASNYGYVTLTNVSLDEPLTLLLKLEGGTLSNFTDSLTAAGVTWALASGDYDVSILLDPAVSGATQFAWDLSSIDSGMTLQGIATHVAPETIGDLVDLPSDPEGLGKILCAKIDLNLPGLEEVKQQADLGDGHYAAALTAWRDYKVKFLRAADPGDLRWHSLQGLPAAVDPVEYLVGRLPAGEEQTKIDARMLLFFLSSDIIGAPGSGEAPPVLWLAQDDSGNYFDTYQSFSFSNGFSARYWQSGDTVYPSKWFQFTADFARNQKHQVELLDAATRRLVPCNWSGQSTFSQADRVQNIIRILSIFCKSLPNSGRPAEWDNVCRPLAAPVAQADRDLIPAVELAQIALSLVQDHPAALLEVYSKPLSVPNQRRNGLAAVLLIAASFPEFSASVDVAENGTAGLDDYLEGAFYRDGGMMEQSFNYNLSDAPALEDMAGWLELSYPELAAKLRSRATAFYQLAAALSTPGAYLPALASYGLVFPPLIWSDANARVNWLASQTANMPGISDPLVAQIAGQFQDTPSTPVPAFTSVTFPYSGYSAQRRDWSWQSPYLFMQTGRPGRGHRSMGHNAIQVSAYGRPLLVSCGVPVYSPDQLPVEMRGDFDAINELLGENSSWKTNTVLVDGRSQANTVPANQEVETTPIEARWHTSEQFDFMEGLYDLGYPEKDMDHHRQVIFVRDPGFWIVTDEMNNRDGLEHSFTQVWNFPAYLNVSNRHFWGFTADQMVMDPVARRFHTSDPNGPNLWFYHFGASGLTYTKYYGNTTPYRGWNTYGFGLLTPAPCVTVDWTSPGHSLLVTVIWPSPLNAPPLGGTLDLSPQGDATQAGVSFSLPDGRLLTYRVAHDPQTFTASGVTVQAKALLSIESPSGVTHGLVLDSDGSGGMPTDYEFTKEGGSISEVIPITTPQGFHWQETPAGIIPNYEPDEE